LTGIGFGSRFKDSRLGQFAKEPVRAALGRLGLDVVPLRRQETDTLGSLLTDDRLGTLYDVGANQGQYAVRARLLGYRGDIVSFEPGAEAFRLLNRRAAVDPRWRTHHMALGRAPGQQQLQVSQNSVSSSLLQVNTTHIAAAPSSQVRGVESVQVARLDDVTSPSDGPCWLKVDTQGYEMEVLAGADETLARARVLQLELSLTELYDGQAAFLDVLLFVKARGFQVFDLLPGFRAESGQLLQCDVIAVRQG